MHLELELVPEIMLLGGKMLQSVQAHGSSCAIMTLDILDRSAKGNAAGASPGLVLAG